MTLYEIKQEMEDAINAVFANVDEETGEVPEEAVAKLSELQMQRDEKLDNLGAYIKNLSAEVDSLKAEEKNLKARREVKEHKIESLKAYVSECLNGEKFESARVAFSFRKSESVGIDDVNSLPDEFKISETSVKADKKAIKDAIKNGQDVHGAWLETKQNLQIK